MRETPQQDRGCVVHIEYDALTLLPANLHHHGPDEPARHAYTFNSGHDTDFEYQDVGSVYTAGPEKKPRLLNLERSCLSNFSRPLPESGGASVLLRKKAQRNSVASGR